MSGQGPRRRRARVLKRGPSRRESIENWRSGPMVPIGPEVIGSKCIQGDQDDGFRGRGGNHWLVSPTAAPAAAQEAQGCEGCDGECACGSPKSTERDNPHRAILAGGNGARKSKRSANPRDRVRFPPGQNCFASHACPFNTWGHRLRPQIPLSGPTLVRPLVGGDHALTPIGARRWAGRTQRSFQLVTE